MKKTDNSPAHASARLTKAQAALTKTTIAQINGDKDHGWGETDSLAAIEAIVNEEFPEGHVLSEESLALIAYVVNPSAYRQKLESKKLLNKSTGTRNSKPLDFLKVA